MKRMIWVLLLGLLWRGSCAKSQNPKRCFKREGTRLVVADNFNGVIETQKHLHLGNGCIVFVQTNGENQTLGRVWPLMEKKDDAYRLLISRWHVRKKVGVFVLQGTHCNTSVSNLTENHMDTCVFNHISKAPCQVRCLHTSICKQSTYDANYCNATGPRLKNRYIINITATNDECVSCDNPVKKPEAVIDLHATFTFNATLEPGEQLTAAQSAEVMNKMADLAASITTSSASVTVAEGITGVLVKETEPEEVNEVSFAYETPNDTIYILNSREDLAPFSRSVTVSKEAFEQAVGLNVSVPFAALFRFINFAEDELNSTILGNEVLAVELGTHVTNLTDKIHVNFWNMKYEGIPSCRSWNGEGSQPHWIDDGCETIKNGVNITCQCKHLTFFAVLLAPLNETISSSHLNTLTTITQIGSGLSMFFLVVVLFGHFLVRRDKASAATTILVQLMLAMFLLNLAFVVNNYVAKLKSPVGCKIMAALMHYFMLATFTWFAVQAFHLCLQLYTGGKVLIPHYILKVSIISWVLPSIIGIVLLILGKYGEQVIYTDVAEDNVTMCWITDNVVHLIVNLGYYVLVFLFTFTTFIVIVSWLFFLKGTSTGNGQTNTSGKRIVTILGLCCILGVTWGFAFFSFSVLQIPAYYIFTVLNSLQGFFLCIYYWSTSYPRERNGTEGDSNASSNTGTVVTSLGSTNNPYF